MRTFAPTTWKHRAGIPARVAIAAAVACLASLGPAPHAWASDGPVNTQVPSISGTPQDGDLLTASSGTWSNSPTSYSYQWKDCDDFGDCVDDPGGTNSTYLVSEWDIGWEVEVQVTATNASGYAASTSDPVTITTNGPSNTALPAITGTAQVGVQLSATTGSWSGSPTNYTYQWFECRDATEEDCSAISLATNSTYTPTSTEADSPLAVVVFAINSSGTSQAAWSLATDDVAPAPATPPSTPPAATFANLSQPTIAGTAQVGQTLTASPGAWQGLPTFAYQWVVCNAAGAACAAIPGATAKTYSIASAYAGDTLRVDVTATFGGSGVVAASGQTAVVAAPAKAVSAPAKPHPISLADAGVRAVAHSSRLASFLAHGLAVSVTAGPAARYSFTLTGVSPVRSRLSTLSLSLRAKQRAKVTLVPLRRFDRALRRASRVTIKLTIDVTVGTHVGVATESIVVRR